MASVVLTDHAWPEVEVERRIIEAAGHHLLAKLATASEEQVDDVVRQPPRRSTWSRVSPTRPASSSPAQT